MFGAFFVGLLVEALSKFRKRLHRARVTAVEMRDDAAVARARGLLVGAHFLQSVLGYLAMFAAMTYAVELFAAVCLGATCGYALLNLDDEPAASTDPCCQAQCPAMEVKVVPDGSATAELPTRDVAPADVELPTCCGGAAAALEETKREDAV
mmetsp:Transcript_4801/g.14981  ORF Transcript_4801/g.14981 Transcript_4801/m.14981 type:complete len:152 (-) Transcript_4801:25-480(-)